jgi:hypothetical protein
MPQSWDMGQILLLSPPKKGMLRIFTSVKIQQLAFLRRGLNLRPWEPEVSMLTTRPPKPSYIHLHVKYFLFFCGFNST